MHFICGAHRQALTASEGVLRADVSRITNQDSVVSTEDSTTNPDLMMKVEKVEITACAITEELSGNLKNTGRSMLFTTGNLFLQSYLSCLLLLKWTP